MNPRYIPDRGVKSAWKTVVCDTEPCGKCGCLFVSVVTPRYSFPIDTVALCCAACGSVVDYIDKLLLITVKQAIRERVAQGTSKAWVVSGKGHGTASEVHKEATYGLVREMILFGLENGLSKQDVAEALEVTEEYVSLIGGS